MDEGLAFWIGVIFGGIIAAFVSHSITQYNDESAVARGELACEHYRSELICWNPKEEER